VAREGTFDREPPNPLAWVGAFITAGGLVGVLVQPILMRRIIDGARCLRFNFDPSAITLGPIGMMLIMVSRLWVQSV